MKALQNRGLSQREACKIMRARRRSPNERPHLKALEDAPLIARTELAQARPRSGCKRLYAAYEREAREGDSYMNYKRFRRLYRLGICRFRNAAGGAAKYVRGVALRRADHRTISGPWTSFPIGCCTAVSPRADVAR